MKQNYNRWLLLLIVTVGSIIGLVRGDEARQKWVFKIKNRFEEKRQVEEQRKTVREGGILLDDIELAAYHKS